MSEGYCECPCCGDIAIDLGRGEVCDECQAAGCELDDLDGILLGLDCQIPECHECGERASLLTDGEWHSNCDEDCENEGKTWSAQTAEART